ncbi:hypothetical protein HaLaN_20645 [Haematococcus lacustris]|uniref:Uncharacterized protein n=1 Tax=Haematococcus lacustris TaxID=44745 RepID=A0A699ZXU0_HAELA|nr:hypothetical protein HaLaN_20645 [Haematococcus lacustris]
MRMDMTRALHGHGPFRNGSDAQESFPPLDDLKIRSSLTVPRALQCGAMQGRIVQAGQTRLNAGLMRRSHRACRTRLSAAVYLNAATDTVRLPLQPQQLLGLEPNKDHKDSDVNQVYDELILSLTVRDPFTTTMPLEQP